MLHDIESSDKGGRFKDSILLGGDRIPPEAGGRKRGSPPTEMELYGFDGPADPQSLIAKKFKHNKDLVINEHGDTPDVVETDGAEHSSSSKSGKTHSTDNDLVESFKFYHDDADDVGDCPDDLLSDPEEDSEYDEDAVEYLLEDDSSYLEMQAQFDNVDLPSGVEASVPWLVDSGPAENPKADTESSNTANSSKASGSSSNDKNEEMMDDVLRKLMYFKQFDTVEDYSDHFFKSKGLVGDNIQPPKPWAKHIQNEWKILEENLPETIFVRVYESRMDLLRAAIIGPDGTPYHDGLFFFDVMFPSSYPNSPPLVHFHSGGLRLNPNLYNCGKVCLSLLGTWSGNSNEMWIPGRSTMLQVLVSIQALILNAKPFFNEPGYESSYKGAKGEKMSKKYSEQVFLLSCKTMMYSLRNPPKKIGISHSFGSIINISRAGVSSATTPVLKTGHFKDLVAGHFRIRAPDIMTACRVYSEGAEVGSNIRKIIKQGEQIENNNSAEFKSSLAQVASNLNAAFIMNGSKDCNQVQPEQPQTIP